MPRCEHGGFLPSLPSSTHEKPLTCRDKSRIHSYGPPFERGRSHFLTFSPALFINFKKTRSLMEDVPRYLWHWEIADTLPQVREGRNNHGIHMVTKGPYWINMPCLRDWEMFFELFCYGYFVPNGKEPELCHQASVRQIGDFSIRHSFPCIIREFGEDFSLPLHPRAFCFFWPQKLASGSSGGGVTRLRVYWDS